MALSIKTQEADRLARELSSLTGRSMTAVVTEALAEKLERERANAPPTPIDREALAVIFRRMRDGVAPGPYTKEEADEICDAGIDEWLAERSR